MEVSLPYEALGPLNGRPPAESTPPSLQKRRPHASDPSPGFFLPPKSHSVSPPSPDDDVGNVDAPDAEGTGQRVKRHAQEHEHEREREREHERDRVNDYVSKKQRKHGRRRLFLHINRRLIDVKTDFVHRRAEQLLYISV